MIKYLLAFVLTLVLASVSYAQCEGGSCKVRKVAPVRNTVSAVANRVKERPVLRTVRAKSVAVLKRAVTPLKNVRARVRTRVSARRCCH